VLVTEAIEQRRLAHSCLAVHEGERTARIDGDSAERLRQCRELDFPLEELPFRDRANRQQAPPAVEFESHIVHRQTSRGKTRG
jgi:hypothetical protein